MKKWLFIAVSLVMFIQTTYATIPGPPRVVECPKCGKEKRLISLISGNTFGAVQWSDMYMDAPMLPRVSPVQKCHGCGRYFMLSKANKSYADDGDYSAETGRLTFAEMKEALSELEKDSLEKDEEFILRMEFLHRYNDAFRYYDEETDDGVPNKYSWKHSDADKCLHHHNLMALIALMDETNNDKLPLIAELYREAGEFEKCIRLMKDYIPDSNFMRDFAESEISKAEAKDNKIFLLIEN